MTSPSPDLVSEVAFWRALAGKRGEVIRALHEFNYWHESTVARGEVIAGLEQSLALWRERCLAAEANLRSPVASPSTRRQWWMACRRQLGQLRDVVRRVADSRR